MSAKAVNAITPLRFVLLYDPIFLGLFSRIGSNKWSSLKGVSFQAALPDRESIKEILNFISMYWGRIELLHSAKQAPLYSFYFRHSNQFALELTISIVGIGLPKNQAVICGSALAQEGLFEFRWGCEKKLSLMKAENITIPLVLSEPSLDRYLSEALPAYPILDIKEADLFADKVMNGV